MGNLTMRTILSALAIAVVSVIAHNVIQGNIDIASLMTPAVREAGIAAGTMVLGVVSVFGFFMGAE